MIRFAFLLLVGCSSVSVTTHSPSQDLELVGAFIYPFGFRWEEPAYRSFELSQRLVGSAIEVGGTAEVISDTLQKLSNDKVKIRVLHSGVGAITETDVLLASASNAIIVGFNVRPNAAAKDALFVATAGIWEDGEGRIIRPHRDQIKFVPRRPLAMGHLGSLSA